MINLKIRKMGNSLGVLLSRDVIRRLKVNEGEKVYLTEAPDGSYRITPYNPEFEKQMQIAEKGRAQYRNTLKSLAK